MAFTLHSISVALVSHVLPGKANSVYVCMKRCVKSFIKLRNCMTHRFEFVLPFRSNSFPGNFSYAKGHSGSTTDSHQCFSVHGRLSRILCAVGKPHNKMTQHGNAKSSANIRQIMRRVVVGKCREYGVFTKYLAHDIKISIFKTVHFSSLHHHTANGPALNASGTSNFIPSEQYYAKGLSRTPVLYGVLEGGEQSNLVMGSQFFVFVRATHFTIKNNQLGSKIDTD